MKSDNIGSADILSILYYFGYMVHLKYFYDILSPRSLNHCYKRTFVSMPGLLGYNTIQFATAKCCFSLCIFLTSVLLLRMNIIIKLFNNVFLNYASENEDVVLLINKYTDIIKASNESIDDEKNWSMVHFQMSCLALIIGILWKKQKKQYFRTIFLFLVVGI